MRNPNLQQTRSKDNNQVTTGINLIVDFYRSPLTRALELLKSRGFSLKDLSDIVFNGEVSPQAINQNYLRRGKK